MTDLRRSKGLTKRGADLAADEVGQLALARAFDGKAQPMNLAAGGALRVAVESAPAGGDASAANQAAEIARLDTVITKLQEIVGFTDGLETMAAATNAALLAISGFTDGLEALAAAATPAGENFIGGVGGRAAVVTQTMAGASANGAPYVAGDLFGSNAAANNAANLFVLAAARAINQSFLVSRIRAKVNDTAFAGKRVKFWFFKSQPTALPGDNGAVAAGAALSESLLIGTATITFGATASSDGLVKGFGYPDDAAGVVWTCEPDAGTRNIYAVAELVDAVTVTAAGKTMALAIEVPGQN